MSRSPRDVAKEIVEQAKVGTLHVLSSSSISSCKLSSSRYQVMNPIVCFYNEETTGPLCNAHKVAVYLSTNERGVTCPACVAKLADREIMRIAGIVE